MRTLFSDGNDSSTVPRSGGHLRMPSQQKQHARTGVPVISLSAPLPPPASPAVAGTCVKDGKASR
jgi:hypothetical protein